MQPGQKLQHYELRERIGKGGFGEVYLARDLFLDIDVAIKILLPQFASNEDMVRRFNLGASAAAKLQHPNIIRVLYMGEVPTEQIFYTVMEYLPNGMLDDRLDRVMALDEAIRDFVHIADAATFAHMNGFIHRDLKPKNILYNHADQPVITDFDLSRVVGQARMTQTGIAMGTLRYLSPEQAIGEDVSPQSDVYSLGIMLFRMITGRLPYESRNVGELLNMHLRAPIPKATDFNSYLPRDVDEIVAIALAKRPEDRFESAKDFANALLAAVPESGAIERVGVGKGADDELEGDTDITLVRTILTLVEGRKRGLQIQLRGNVFRIGYSDKDGNELGLQDDYVSGHHGRFEWRNEAWVYIDQNSTNGSFLVMDNGAKKRLPPEQPYPLKFGDLLELGDTVIRVDAAHE